MWRSSLIPTRCDGCSQRRSHNCDGVGWCRPHLGVVHEDGEENGGDAAQGGMMMVEPLTPELSSAGTIDAQAELRKQHGCH